MYGWADLNEILVVPSIVLIQAFELTAVADQCLPVLLVHIDKISDCFCNFLYSYDISHIKLYITIIETLNCCDRRFKLRYCLLIQTQFHYIGVTNFTSRVWDKNYFIFLETFGLNWILNQIIINIIDSFILVSFEKSLDGYQRYRCPQLRYLKTGSIFCHIVIQHDYGVSIFCMNPNFHDESFVYL